MTKYQRSYQELVKSVPTHILLLLRDDANSKIYNVQLRKDARRLAERHWAMLTTELLNREEVACAAGHCHNRPEWRERSTG